MYYIDCGIKRFLCLFVILTSYIHTYIFIHKRLSFQVHSQEVCTYIPLNALTKMCIMRSMIHSLNNTKDSLTNTNRTSYPCTRTRMQCTEVYRQFSHLQVIYICTYTDGIKIHTTALYYV